MKIILIAIFFNILYHIWQNVEGGALKWAVRKKYLLTSRNIN